METEIERTTKTFIAPQTTEQKERSPLNHYINFRKSKHPVMVSKHLSKTQIRGMLNAGDVIINGDNANFPKFSETTFINQIDRMLDYMNEDDRAGLLALFTIFAFSPDFLIKFIMYLSKINNKFPDFIGAPLRMIDIGVRGVFFTMYYSKMDDPKQSSKKIFAELEYESKVVTNFKLQNNNTDHVQEVNSTHDVSKIYDQASTEQTRLKKLTVTQRLRYISALKDLILKKKEYIIDRIVEDTMKSRSDALFSEIFPVLDHLDFLEKNAKKLLKKQKIKTPIALLGKKSQVHYSPLGTILIISPWNYPFYQAIAPITTAFITGNTSIYKPSEYTPLYGLVEELLSDIGMEKFWVQVIYGDSSTGKLLVEGNPDKIFFTGSLSTGKKIMAEAAKTVTPVELELGGKDPMIVFETANLTRSVAGATWGAFTNSGQSCTSVERLLIHESIYDQFKNQLVKATKKIKLSNENSKDSDIGAVYIDAQKQIIIRHLEDAIEKGATVLTGNSWDRKSNLIPPIILEDVTEDMMVYKDETFGPILPIFKFYDETHAIKIANDSIYGLSASIWGNNKEQLERVTSALETGNISVNNVMLSEGNHYLPFGGAKHSGFGRFKGTFGLQSFSNIKSVLYDGNSNKIEANWYPYTEKKYHLFSQVTEGLFGRGIKNFFKFLISGLKLEMYSDKVGKKGR